MTAYAAEIFFLLRNPHLGGMEKLLSFTRYRIRHSAWAASIGHLVPQVDDLVKEMGNVLFLYELKRSWGGDCLQDLQTQSVVRADAGFPLFIKDGGVAACCSAELSCKRSF